DTAESAIGVAVGRIGKNLEAAVDRHQTCADEKLDSVLFWRASLFRLFGFFLLDCSPRVIRAHDAGETVAVGDADGGKAEHIGSYDHLPRMRSPAQEGEIRCHGEFGIGRRRRACFGWANTPAFVSGQARSEERRVGKECRWRG